MITRFIQTIILTIMMFSVVSSVKSQDLESFEKRVTEFTLSNGLTFIVVENHEAPVVSLLTYADVGSVDEVKGITGLAHVFEHMAFKGTTSVGAKDLIKEYAAMKEVDEIYNELRSEYHQGSHANPERIKE